MLPYNCTCPIFQKWNNTTLQHEVFALESKPKQKGVEEEGSIVKARASSA